MQYLVGKDNFTKINETKGTIQNASKITTIEVSNAPVPGSGILLSPTSKFTFEIDGVYVRCVDGAGAEVRVVPFEVAGEGGGGGGLTRPDFALNQIGSNVVSDFAFSALEYPNTTNPNLDGKTVLVLTEKDVNGESDAVKYVFVDLAKVIDVYSAGNSSILVTDGDISVQISKAQNNILSLADDGLFANLAVSGAVSDNFAIFDESGRVVDGGLSFADLRYELPTASSSTKGGVKVGSGLSISSDTLSAPVMTAASSTAGGASGLVPAPSAGDNTKFLRGDGSWVVPTDTNTTYSAATTTTSGLMSAADKKKLNSLASITTAGSNITISGGTISASNPVMTGATASTNGAKGLVPAPGTGDNYRFLRGDGTWASPPVIIGGESSTSILNPPPGAPALGTTLNDCTWEQISVVSQAGLGDAYFDIGDCKEITLNGKIGDCLTLTNEKLCVFILHFNYAMNGTAENNIIFGGFKTALTNGKAVALCDSKYNTSSTDGTICFNQNHWGNANHGGWKGSDLRYDVLGATSTQPSDYGKEHTGACVGYNATASTLTSPKANTLLDALPSDFRNALRLWSRWVDAHGTRVEASIEKTIDAVTLLAEFEVHGKRTCANQYEQNHQTQMAYYATGNSKIKYNHTSISSSVYWWCSSPHSTTGNNFCNVSTDGSANYSNAYRAYGVSPAFKV